MMNPTLSGEVDLKIETLLVILVRLRDVEQRPGRELPVSVLL